MDPKEIIMYALIALAVYCLFFKKSENFGIDEQLSTVYKVDTNMCSPDCCGTQWPVSFPLKKDERVNQEKIGEEYVPTNMTCTGLRGRGCVCADKKQYEFLKSRGTNS